MKRYSLEKKKRLTGNRQFRAVMSRRIRVSDAILTLYMAANDCGYARLGVSVGKARGNAVVRNRLKRLLREAFRQSAGNVADGFDYVLMISPGWLKSECGAMSPARCSRNLSLERVRHSFVTLAAEALLMTGRKRQ